MESVVLLGTPVGVHPERWHIARSAVSGRFVNGYSRRDWILGFVYRGSKGMPAPLLFLRRTPCSAEKPV